MAPWGKRFVYCGSLCACTLSSWPRLAHAQSTDQAEAPAAAQPTGNAPAHDVVPPELVTSTEVPYPEDQTQDAVVVLKLLITADGKVGEVAILEGQAPFAGIAVEQVKTWTFSPARVNGTAKAAHIRFTVEFIAPQEIPPAAPPPAPPASSPADEEEQEIVVVGQRVPGTTRVMSDAESMIIPGAEGDPVRAIEAMPGVVPVLSSGPFIGVRGASPGMVGYQFDGIAVPYLFHLARGPAVANPWLVDSAALYGTGGPARLGRAVGGTIEARAARPEGRYRAQARIRLTDASLGAEAPFAGGKGNVMVAGRYSYTQLMVALIAPEFMLNYWDYQLRTSYQLDARNSIEFLGFGAGDHSGIKLDDGSVDDLMNASFHRASVRYNHLTKGGTKQRISLTYGHDRWDGRPEPILPRSHSINARFESDAPFLDKDGRRKAQLQWGAESELRFQKDDYYTDASETSATSYHRTDWSAGAWLDYGLYASPKTVLDLGVRGDVFGNSSSPLVDAAVGWSVTPRFAASHQLHRAVRLHTSVGVNSQLRSPAQRAPGRGFTPNGGLEYSILSDFGSEFTLPLGFNADTTVFQNAYFNTMDAEHLRFIQGQAPDPRALGQAMGFEVALKRMLAKHLRGFIAYTYSHSTRSIGRVTSAAAYDRRHVVDGALAYDFGRGWGVSTRATYYTGYQARMASVDSLKDAPRTQPYFQLDVQAAKRFELSAGRYWAITAGVLNGTLSQDSNDMYCDNGGCVEERVGPATIPTIGVEGEL